MLPSVPGVVIVRGGNCDWGGGHSNDATVVMVRFGGPPSPLWAFRGTPLASPAVAPGTQSLSARALSSRGTRGGRASGVLGVEEALN